MKVLRTAYWLIIALFATLMGALYLPAFWLLKKTGRHALYRRWVYRYAHWWGKVVLKATGSKVTVRGLENVPSGPVVFMGNHLGIFDVMLLLGQIDKPIAFIAKKELAKIPIISSLMGHVGCLYLDRQDVRQAARTFSQAIRQIRQGLSMVIFPEGTRSQTGQIAEFKSGSMKLAIKAGVPIVPLRIEGTGRVFENNGHRIGPSQISLTVLPPVLPGDYSELGTGQVAKMVREMVGGAGEQVFNEGEHNTRKGGIDFD